MASFNKVILIGNLTRDPEVRYIPSGTAVTDIGLAVNHSWFDKQSNSRKEEVTFVDITLWGRTAEIAGEYLSKGRSVLIEGRLKMDTWQDKETGQNRSKLKVIGEQMTMLGSRGDGGGSGGGPGGGRAAGGSQQAPNQQAPNQQSPNQQAPNQQASGGSPEGAADAFYDSPPQQETGGEVPF